MQSSILAPVIVLVVWTLVMLLWMAATRVPAMASAKLPKTAGQRTSELGAVMPANVQWKADNYNHLMEQPTLYYALVFTLVALDAGTGVNVTLAWAYALSRIVHSLIHATTNVVMLRFAVFMFGSVTLLVMAARAAMLAF